MGLLVEGEVDLQKALDRIKKERGEGMKEASRLEGKLANADFVAKAPAEVVAEHHERLRTLRHEQAMLSSSEQQLKEMMLSRNG